MTTLSRSMFLALLAFGLAACGGEETTGEPPADSGMSDADTEMPADMADDEETAMADDMEPPAPGDLPAALTGTSWQLVSFQSMSDEQGTSYPENPADYILNLGPDGTAAARLNCNRATGTWTAEAGSETAGSFEFGPMAMTRALCQQPSMDEQIARDAQYVRSYLIEDGMLYLSLMADGGIYTWGPVGAGTPDDDMGGDDMGGDGTEVEAMAESETFRDSFTGSMTGSDTVEHTLEGTAGQTMTVSLEGDGTMYFNILPPSAGEEFFPAIWVGHEEIEPDVFTGTLPETGTYRVLVYLLGDDEDSGATRDYTLDVAVE